MKRKFEFEFTDCPSKAEITFDYNAEMDEEMEVVIEQGTTIMYANRQAYLALAKAFIRMALSEYPDGFHFHLGQNFDGDREDAMRFHLVVDSAFSHPLRSDDNLG